MSDNQNKLNEQLVKIVVDGKQSLEVRVRKVKYLVRLGADVNANVFGKSPLLWAKMNFADKEMIAFLEELGAKEWQIDVIEAYKLGMQCREGKVKRKSAKEIEDLIFRGANLESRNEYGRTVLMNAVIRENVEVVKVLLKNGVSVNQVDNDGETALMLASVKNNREIAELLIASGADINKRNNEGQTALSKALRCRSDDVVKLLEQCGGTKCYDITKAEMYLDKFFETGYNKVMKTMEEKLPDARKIKGVMGNVLGRWIC